MPARTDTHLLLRAFVDELARCGVREACTSPGSRCTPLVLALVRDGRLRCHSHIDERCSGFFAVGAAQATGLPVAITCTSGTAAANLAPAVIEAFHARLPLIVLTADRPPELREVGAGQTIDQIRLYGSAAKWFFEVGTHEATPARLRWMRMLACRAVWTALGGRPGPVHLNFSLREPLVPPDQLEDEPVPGRGRGRPWVAAPRSTPYPHEAAQALVQALGKARYPLIVAGRLARAQTGVEVARFAAHVGWPLLADPLSGARHGPTAIAHYDSLLRVSSFASMVAPDFVLRVGDMPTSKPLRAWLEGLDDDIPQVTLDREEAWQDPAGGTSLLLDAGAATSLAIASEQIAKPDAAWPAAWRTADRQAAEIIAEVLGNDLTEPHVVTELGARLPPGATLFVASSMPIRDVESFFVAREDSPRVLSNRGANGIDGTVSSALGVAATTDEPVVLLIGDVALLHDIGGLLAAKRLGLSLTIVLLNNDGGGIFEFLPVAAARDAFERHVATPHGVQFEHAAALYGCVHAPVSTLGALRAALRASIADRGVTLIEVKTDRTENVALHRAVNAAVYDALT